MGVEKHYKVGIVGCGSIFPMHAVSVKQLSNATVTAVCDIKEDRVQKAAADFECTAYSDYKDMIDNADIDVVHVCTPHYMHAPIVIYAAQKGKHILTEKPMSIHLEDAQNMIKAAKDNNVTLGVIFQNRYNPGSRLVKENLESGKLGKILGAKLAVTWMRTDEYYSRSDWKGTWEKEGGGVIIDQAIHTLDLARWLINDQLAWVDASTTNRAHDIIEVEDSAEGVVSFKNGVNLAFFTINYYTYDSSVELELHCENGICNIVGDRATINFNDCTTISASPNPNDAMDFGDGVKQYWGSSHVKQIKAYYDSLVAGTVPFISGDDAIETQRMVCAIYESGRTGKRVNL